MSAAFKLRRAGYRAPSELHVRAIPEQLEPLECHPSGRPRLIVDFDVVRVQAEPNVLFVMRDGPLQDSDSA